MAQSTIGTVYLNVANLEQLAAFYQDIIGLKVHRRDGNTLHLGVGGDDLLVLTETPGGKRVPGTTGLYHFAILVLSRLDLARSLKHIAETNTPLQGLSDHFVSEAIYLADPEGNGIEIYRDRPASGWFQDGSLHMGTVAMDVDGVLGELDRQDEDIPWTGLHPDTVMGHIHLHVASVRESEAFYRDLLGFDVMLNMESATFMSVDRYHHHIGANTWAGRVPPPPSTLGLDKYVIHLPGSDQLNAILTRLDQANVPVEESGVGYRVADPSNNYIVLTAPASKA
jgi:catechol 2,3-dioxygenase